MTKQNTHTNVIASKAKQSLTPQLRFPEFKGEWKEKEFGEICTIKTGCRDTQDRKDEGKFPFFVRSNTVEKIDSYSFDGEAILTSGDGVGVGKNFHYINGKFDYHQRVYALHSFKSEYLGRFVYHLFSERFYRRVYRLSAKNSVDSVRMEMISKMKEFFPSQPEQQKIAHFLSAVDARIHTLEQKKSGLEQYKKGVMQKIFSQEIRFKNDDGSAFVEWETLPLKEVFNRSKEKNVNNEFNLVLTNSATKGIVSQNDYFDKDIANSSNLGGYYVVKKDDFIYNPRISQSAPVGPLNRNKLKKGVMSPLYTVLKHIKGNIDFLEIYFKSSHWHRHMKSIANYGARHDRMNITMTDFENMPIPFPCEKEQTKIANFLSAIDKNIALVNSKIEHSKTYKKGLLQQLFV